jgi:uncharacterized membrane protein YqjE
MMTAVQMDFIRLELISIALLILLLRGGFRTFRRDWLIATLLLLLFTPVWILWALIENIRNQKC